MAILHKGSPAFTNPRNLEPATLGMRPQGSNQLGTIDRIEAPHAAMLP